MAAQLRGGPPSLTPEPRLGTAKPTWKAWHLAPPSLRGKPSDTTAQHLLMEGSGPLGGQAAGADRGSYEHPRSAFQV